MCNLYSVTKGQTSCRSAARVPRSWRPAASSRPRRSRPSSRAPPSPAAATNAMTMTGCWRAAAWAGRTSRLGWLSRGGGSPSAGTRPSWWRRRRRPGPRSAACGKPALSRPGSSGRGAGPRPAARRRAAALIKGNISREGERIYHTPWGDRFYERTRIDEGRGERWFCSEKEAAASGFRAPLLR